MGLMGLFGEFFCLLPVWPSLIPVKELSTVLFMKDAVFWEMVGF
jgi:hypothetical protein